MNAFRRFGWERQLAAADRQKQDSGAAVGFACPLAVIHERKKDDIPYFRAGFVCHRIQELIGETQKASELQWKRQWTSTYKAKYYPVRRLVRYGFSNETQHPRYQEAVTSISVNNLDTCECI